MHGIPRSFARTGMHLRRFSNMKQALIGAVVTCFLAGCSPSTQPMKKAMAAAKAAVVPLPMTLTPVPELDQRLFDPRFVADAIEGLNKRDYKKAAVHSWHLWQLVNQEVGGNNGFGRSPKWRTWCQPSEALSGEAKPYCVVMRSTVTFAKEREPWSALELRDKFREAPSLTTTSREMSRGHALRMASTTHLDPHTLNGLYQLLRKLGNGTQCKVGGGVLNPSLLTNCIAQANKEPSIANAELERAIPPNAVVVKAEWVRVRPLAGAPNRGEYLNYWQGPESWERAFWPVAGSAQSNWSQRFRKSVALPQRTSTCPWTGPIGNEGNEFVPISDFYYEQKCDDTPQANLSKFDFLVLTGLHIITNAHPAGDWTWSTFYWHPSELAQGGVERGSRAEELQKHRPSEITGWRSHYRMDLQYVASELNPPHPGVLRAVTTAATASNDPCEVRGRPVVAGMMFNPYIEGRFQCGGISNCMGCHANARRGASQGLSSKVNRTGPDANTLKSNIFTHRLWSLARVQAP